MFTPSFSKVSPLSVSGMKIKMIFNEITSKGRRAVRYRDPTLQQEVDSKEESIL